MPPNKGKGKGKARADPPHETSPLLGSPSTSIRRQALEDEPRRPDGHRLRSALLTGLVVLFSLVLSATLFLILLAWSFKPSRSEIDALPRTAFRYDMPNRIEVLNVTDDGVHVNVSLRVGIDVDRALGVQGYASQEEQKAAEVNGERGLGAAWWENLRRWTAQKALDSMGKRSVRANITSPIYVFPHHLSSSPLLSVSLTSPLDIPLVAGVPPFPLGVKPDWLQPTWFTAIARPVASTGELWEYAQRVWAEGQARVVVGVSRVEAEVPGVEWWTKYTRQVKEDLVVAVQVPVPRLPGLPAPGRQLNLSSLVHLESYAFSNDDKSLYISAHATLPNFLPNINTTIPFGVPFTISLPAINSFSATESRMAEVVTAPVHILNNATHIRLSMAGEVTADLSDDNSSSPLSLFLQNFLHGLDNPIIVRGMSAVPTFAPPATIHPPRWLLSTLPSLSVPLVFPGPTPPPKIIQRVTIEHMRISEASGKMHASGTVVAEVELPSGMQHVDVDVIAVLPDVFVFDGPAPDDTTETEPGQEQDYPARAFGHIHPDMYLPSTTSPSTDPLHPHRLIVRAPLKDVPLDILPGRDTVLSDFVGKVVFKGGAEAGVKGKADVRVQVRGVGGRVALTALPVKGEFWVGRQRVA
ncbi:hypothetical protein BCR39DRAFT_550382 [Naematelia encephala]|uniref:Uncharacterized protein n=1 Tax=Naematelia encephala TaxID=71784 RepID=A0A1Y2AKA7_9TREE|nr:hypothetical protein BCR39DRAFT_550382 [Naematelia encephala]